MYLYVSYKLRINSCFFPYIHLGDMIIHQNAIFLFTTLSQYLNIFKTVVQPNQNHKSNTSTIISVVLIFFEF